MKLTLPHIVSEFLEKNFKVDEIIASTSEAIFDFDKTSRIILGTLGINGSLAERRIYMTTNIPNTTVRRKLIGRETKSKTLKELECVVQTKGRITIRYKKKVKKPEKENIYSLTLKGLLISLALSEKYPFEKNYLVKQFGNLIFTKFDEKYEISRYVLQLIKYHIALFLLWHKINGLELTRHQNFSNYFIDWNESNFNLNINYPGLFSRQPEDWIDFNETRIRFFALQSIVTIFLNKLKAHRLEFVWNEKMISNSDFTYNSTSYYDLIKFWPYYIENLQWEDFESYDPKKIESDDPVVEWDLKDINEIRDKILAEMKISERPPLKKQKLIWQVR